MSPELDLAETARRVRAAIAYADTTARFGRKGAAGALGISVAKIDRMTGTKPDSPLRPTWEQLRQLAIACGLPPAFFFADFDRLEELVGEGLPRFGPTRQPEAGDPPPPPDELLQQPEAPEPTQRTATDDASPQVADSTRDRPR